MITFSSFLLLLGGTYVFIKRKLLKKLCIHVCQVLKTAHSKAINLITNLIPVLYVHNYNWIKLVNFNVNSIHYCKLFLCNCSKLVHNCKGHFHFCSLSAVHIYIYTWFISLYTFTLSHDRYTYINWTCSWPAPNFRLQRITLKYLYVNYSFQQILYSICWHATITACLSSSWSSCSSSRPCV